MKKLSFIFIIALLIGVLSCSKKEDSSSTTPTPVSGKATLKIKLVDAPALYDAVNIDILSMKINLGGSWIDLPVANPGIYNLLNFTNGNSLLLIGDTSLPAGTIREVRLLLGDSNTVVVDGIPYFMQTPSGQSSGYKIKMDSMAMQPGVVYSLVIDFDANESVHKTGNGKYMLKPVCRGYFETAIGAIDGIILPHHAAYYVQATNAVDTAGTPIDTLTGNFLISAVMPGVYNVKFFADSGFHDTVVSGVTVLAGQTTHMDTVPIP